MSSYLELNTWVVAGEPVDTDSIVDEIKEEFMPVLEENGGAIIRDNLLPVITDRGKVRQVFYNLIDNSIKFARKGVPPAIMISCKRENNLVVFSVKDNGIGVPHIYFNKIFIIFQKLHTKEEYEGNGIGLALCKKIVEGLGGSIWVVSEEGAGTEMFFSMPAV